jgi:hypothetical protein
VAITVTFVLPLFPPRCERLPVRELVARVLGRPVARERLERDVELERLARRALVRRDPVRELRRVRDCEPPRLVDAVRREEDVPRAVDRERLPLDLLRDRERAVVERFFPAPDRLRPPLEIRWRPVLRDRAPPLCRDAVRRPPRFDDVPRWELPPDPSALPRLTSLLKLLFCPFAVWSCTSKARPLSSNFWNHSSHSISSREPSPL